MERSTLTKKDRINAAQKRIQELQILIKHWSRIKSPDTLNTWLEITEDTKVSRNLYEQPKLKTKEV